MHVWVVAETQPDIFKPFEKWINGMEMERSAEEKQRLIEAKMADSNPDKILPAKPLIREVRLYNIVIPEDNKKEFLGILKNHETVGHIDSGKVSLFKRLLRTVLPIKSVDMEKIERVTPQNGKFCDWVNLQVIGTTEDKRNRFGVELT